ncbi:dicer-like protein 4 isoform X1 [Juglans regia]|uniref:Dicer-like protein 4 isoform X1 n=2 Tax=Juglans regia TaxID=51240 RepID=A0A6P9EWA8_JUGRE|nr:dicer-like protein 4 isoform X1 [Juglans regia]
MYVAAVKMQAPEGSLLEGPKCPKAMGDLVESSLGAILLDSGFNLELMWTIMLSFLDPIMRFSSLQISPFRELQELCQSYNWDLQFLTSEKGGMSLVEAQVNGKDVCATASATYGNKKDAIRIASRKISTILKVGQTKRRQDHDCMKSVLLTVGKPLYLNVAERKDQAT